MKNRRISEYIETNSNARCVTNALTKNIYKTWINSLVTYKTHHSQSNSFRINNRKVRVSAVLHNGHLSKHFYYILFDCHLLAMLSTWKVTQNHNLVNKTNLVKNFDVLLTVHLSIFILVIIQLDAQNLFNNKFISCLYTFRAPCAHRQEVKILLYSLWYHHTYRWPSRARDGHL